MPAALHIQRIIRLHDAKIRAFFQRLEQRLAGLDTVFLGRFVFGKDNAVTAFRVAADGNRFVVQFRVAQQFHRRKKSIQITVEDGAVHGTPPLS